MWAGVGFFGDMMVSDWHGNEPKSPIWHTTIYCKLQTTGQHVVVLFMYVIPGLSSKHQGTILNWGGRIYL